jgi:hypothetical protein
MDVWAPDTLSHYWLQLMTQKELGCIYFVAAFAHPGVGGLLQNGLTFRTLNSPSPPASSRQP